jgi:hypothetical protein
MATTTFPEVDPEDGFLLVILVDSLLHTPIQQPLVRLTCG